MQVKDTWHPTKVAKICKNTPQSYIVTKPQGKSYRRNRRHLRKVNEEWIPVEQTNENEQSDENEIYNSALSDDTINNDPPDSFQPATIKATTLRRSQRTIRKPERYSDSQDDNCTHYNYSCTCKKGRCNI